MLALGVSDGFTYTWDATQPAGSPGRPGLDDAQRHADRRDRRPYRVGTLNFLADGGDLFTAFKAGTNLLGGSEDLANLVAYFEATPGPHQRRPTASPVSDRPHQQRGPHPPGCGPRRVRPVGAGGRWYAARERRHPAYSDAMPSPTPPTADADPTSGSTTATASRTPTPGCVTSRTRPAGPPGGRERLRRGRAPSTSRRCARPIVEEIRSRVKETDLSVPVASGPWWYYARTVEGLQYAAQVRAPLTDPAVRPGPRGRHRAGRAGRRRRQRRGGRQRVLLARGAHRQRRPPAVAFAVDTAGDERFDLTDPRHRHR